MPPPVPKQSVPLSRPLRILVFEKQHSLTVASTADIQILDNRERTLLSGSGSVSITTSNGQISINGQPTQQTSINLTSSGTLKCGERGFFGSLRITMAKNYLNTIEIVDIETYLRGVLPREIYATWPTEALKAQALASRTYALYQRSFFSP